jgi:iron-sulfur cluster repair protein YtfE (RIC family)
VTTVTQSAPVLRHHHDRLAAHVDKLPTTADLIGQAQPEELSFALEQSCRFLNELLMPHMDAAEQVVYPELERLFQNQHSMTPMRREHAQIRAHIRDIDLLRGKATEGELSLTHQTRLRRAMFTLYALIKIHLAEEQLYSEIIEAGATPEKEEALAAAMSHEGISSL